MTAPQLIPWLREQIDADERTAQAFKDDKFGLYPDGHSDVARAYLDRFDEDRTLAEVKAKRAILNARPAVSVALILAQPYADRPGFRKEWRIKP